MSLISEQQLEALFHSRTLFRGGERYFDLSTSSDFIDACIENDFAIIGIEGFEMVEGGIRPRMDLIADFSEADHLTWSHFKKHANQSASAFLDAVKDESVLLNFTLLSRSEFSSERNDR